jgi:glucose-1-phosphate cytidylyltransferase
MTNDFTVSLGRRHQITYHDSHEEQDFNVTLAETGANSMTGGRVKRVQKYIDKDLFLVTYGDGLSNVDIGALLAFHRSHGKSATVTTVRPTSRFGNVEIGPDGQVSNFAEKPQLDDWVSAGYFVFHRRVFEYLDGDDCILEREPVERLAREGQLMAYRHQGFFAAMDTYREYTALNEQWASGAAPWKVWK